MTLKKDWYFEELDKFVASYPTPINFNTYINPNIGIGEEMYKYITRRIKESCPLSDPKKAVQRRKEINKLFTEYLNAKKQC